MCIDKPVGISSTDVLRILQKLYTLKEAGHARTLTFSLPKRGDAEPKSFNVTLTPELDAIFEHYSAHNPSTKKLVCGHAGTLDPNASGLMVVGIGAGTKQLKHYVGLPKTYDAEILLGVRTTTSDLEGEVIESMPVPELSEAAVSQTVASMIGTHRLAVSAFSAIKRGGQPLYKLARRGKDTGTLPIRDMQVNRAKYHTHTCADDTCTLSATFDVESGVYIRSLAEELGRRLGYPATLKKLRRTHVGDICVDDPKVIALQVRRGAYAPRRSDDGSI